ncbi:MAG: hypothetical protein HYX79_02655 [Chloroflexi bacterium]|nr:hypothetical protein [Chloroflexota bacterium]
MPDSQLIWTAVVKNYYSERQARIEYGTRYGASFRRYGIGMRIGYHHSAWRLSENGFEEAYDEESLLAPPGFQPSLE